MHIITQCQAEMSDILRRVFGLALQAQHQIINPAPEVIAAALLKYMIKMSGLQRRIVRQFQVQAMQQRINIIQLFFQRLFMHAEHYRQFGLFQTFGCRNIGGNHKFFNNFVAGKVLGRPQRKDMPVVVNLYGYSRTGRGREDQCAE